MKKRRTLEEELLGKKWGEVRRKRGKMGARLEGD